MVHGVVRLGRSARRGFSFIELAVSMAVMSLILAGVVYLYDKDMAVSRGNETVVELMMVIQAVEEVYSGNVASMDTASSSVIVRAAAIPKKWVGPNATLVTPFGTKLDIAPDASWDGRPDLSLMLSGIPRAQCIQLVTSDFGDQVLDITSFTGAHAQGRPFTPTEAQEACPEDTDTFWWGVVP